MKSSNPLPTVADAEESYRELLAALQSAETCKPDYNRAKQSSGGGQLVLFSAPCTCGEHEWFTSQWAEFPPEDCWVKE